MTPTWYWGIRVDCRDYHWSWLIPLGRSPIRWSQKIRNLLSATCFLGTTSKDHITRDWSPCERTRWAFILTILSSSQKVIHSTRLYHPSFLPLPYRYNGALFLSFLFPSEIIAILLSFLISSLKSCPTPKMAEFDYSNTILIVKPVGSDAITSLRSEHNINRLK